MKNVMISSCCKSVKRDDPVTLSLLRVQCIAITSILLIVLLLLSSSSSLSSSYSSINNKQQQVAVNPPQWNVDGPPVTLTPIQSLQSRHKKQHQHQQQQLQQLPSQQQRRKQEETTKDTQNDKSNQQENEETTISEEVDDADAAAAVDDSKALSEFSLSKSFMENVIVPLHASEMLQCQQSVINFVINATDSKDECNGLVKAFDDTCQDIQSDGDGGSSSSSSSSINDEDEQQQQQQPTTKTKQQNRPNQQENKHSNNQQNNNNNNKNNNNNDDNNKNRNQQKPPKHRTQRQRRRRIKETKQKFASLYNIHYFLQHWRTWTYQTMQSLQQYNPFQTYNKADFFLAEDEIVRVWETANYLVEYDLVDSVYQQVQSKLYHNHQTSERDCNIMNTFNQTMQQSRRCLQEMERITEQQGESNNNNNNNNNNTIAAGNSKNKTKPISLDLPTKVQHLSNEIAASEAELMHQTTNTTTDTTTTTTTSSSNTAGNKNDNNNNNNTASETENVAVSSKTCCASILNVYHELCSEDEEEEVSDTRLFFALIIMASCGIVKSLIRHFQILWLPEAAGCILVGVACNVLLIFIPHHDFSFDGNWFLRVLVPPIIFEAALSIDKKSFHRHLIPIVIFAVIGTLTATILTAMVVYFGTSLFHSWCTPIPYIEALTFGALISSIDPIAVLSVLSNMGMTDTDTIYVLIFGESLLNDGVAIVLFETLVEFLDENLVIDRNAIAAAVVHFLVVALGSLFVGMGSGVLSTIYFWLFHGCQTPLVEMLMFFCWALLPYYICDGLGLSGIVGTVAVGFFMDIHIVGEDHSHVHDHQEVDDEDTSDDVDNDLSERSFGSIGRIHNLRDMDQDSSERSFGSRGRVRSWRIWRRPLLNPKGHLSKEARTHIHVITSIISTGMETAIFAYLGFFLFSNRYHWNILLVIVSILSCCVSRAIMVPAMGAISNCCTRIQLHRDRLCPPRNNGSRSTTKDGPAGVFIDRKMQIALWIAGLRGAMSFALVEYIPLYDSYSGEGTRLKAELKAMTSASIIFTVFVLGGNTYCTMQKLGIGPGEDRSHDNMKEKDRILEMTSLVTRDDIDEVEEIKVV